jgi:hypothetical protein
MTLLEYVASLQDQNVPESEWFNKVQEWKKENNYKAPEQVKIKGVAEQTDANASPTETPGASENLESGSGKSQSGLFSTYLQTGIDPFLNEDFKDVFKRSSGKELNKSKISTR